MERTILLYGGAFNPPTLAHTAITQTLINRARTTRAEVWIMPSGERHDKAIHVSLAQRLAYVAAMLASCESDGVVSHIETNELVNQAPTETFTTVKRLEATHPGVRFVWVFGADSVQTMSQWHGGEWLYEHLDMLLIAREGYDVTELPPHAQMLEVATPIVSSTEVRAQLASGQPIKHLVTAQVEAVLRSS